MNRFDEDQLFDRLAARQQLGLDSLHRWRRVSRRRTLQRLWP
jgi:hypothetical protein